MARYLRLNPAISQASPYWRTPRGLQGIYIDAPYTGRKRRGVIGDGVFVQPADVLEVDDRATYDSLSGMTMEAEDGEPLLMFQDLTARARTLDVEGILRGTVTQVAATR